MSLYSLVALGAPPTTITPNGFGTTVTSSAGIYNITGGAQIGNNIFHTFSKFDLGTGDTADFIATATTANILARITGGSPSSIDGTLTSTIGPGGAVSNANLFFINPSGTIFGANAQVNTGGAFVVSTADYIKLSDGALFYADANHPIQDGGLTSAPISAFGFLSTTPTPLLLQNAQLGGSARGGLFFVAGDVTLDTTQLTLTSGSVAIFSAASAGEFPFSLASPLTTNANIGTYGNVTLRNNSAINFTGSSGKVIIRAGKLVIDHSEIDSDNAGAAASGNLTVQSSQIQIVNGGLIATTNSGGGASGNITVMANSVDIDGTSDPADLTGIDAEAEQGSTGDAGNVNLTTSALTMEGGGQIESNTLSSGDGGNVNVTADTITIDGSATPDAATGIFSNSFAADSTDTGATGNAGSIHINVTGAISVVGGGEIASNTSTSGTGGTVFVSADSLRVDGTASPDILTGIFSDSDSTGTGMAGTGGSVIVDTIHGITLTGSGVIASSTSSSGNAGQVVISAGSLSIDGSASPLDLTGIASDSTGSGHGGTVNATILGPVTITGGGEIAAAAFSSGDGGGVRLTVSGAMTITAGGDITAGTFSAGNAGVVNVTSDSLNIDGSGAPGSVTGIDSQADPGATGIAGFVDVTVTNAVSITGGGTISSSTFGPSHAGTVTVDANSISIDGSATPGVITGIVASATAGGDAGSIKVNAPTVALGGTGTIDTTSLGSSAGSITVTSTNVTLTGHASIDSDASTGSGGNIVLKVGQTVYLLDSEIVAQADHTGGNIVIDPLFGVLNNSLISASAFDGSGGNVVIDADHFFLSNSELFATGTIRTTEPDVDLDNSLAALPNGLENNDHRLREKCQRAVNHEFSSFIVVGRGGTETAPEELQPDFGLSDPLAR